MALASLTPGQRVSLLLSNDAASQTEDQIRTTPPNEADLTKSEFQLSVLFWSSKLPPAHGCLSLAEHVSVTRNDEALVSGRVGVL
jgi:hypothetical protein